MKIVDTFPYPVREVENIFIPMRDGCRLAARMWLPEGVETRPLPAIVEYIPYRKRDLSRGRDNGIHPYLCGHGYVCLRVDMRGSGDSDGVLTDEYTLQEQEDGVDVIAWIAEQPWCSGRVGMMGISWGGFNSLHVAAHRPPALAAIVSCCASDDQYADNMHYMGGCLLGDNLSEATVMFAFNSLPPDPRIVGDRWREMWLQRLEGSGLWLEPWLAHQKRSDYWRRGSVCENYDAIRCPVMAVGGWADGFTNALFRLLEHLQVPRLGLVGPWGHKYPHQGMPGPAIGFLQELLRWWDYWLKDVDSGIMDEPMLRAWVQDSISPNNAYDTRPGRWVAEYNWPPRPHPQMQCHLARARLLINQPATDDPHIDQVQSPLHVGVAAGKWCSYQATPDLPGDQRQENGGALVYDSEPLQEAIDVLGLPWVDLEIAADRPQAMVAVRLSDVAPDGKTTRTTYGLLNLAHRESDAHPEPLEPGRFYRVRVYLNGIGHRFPVGHRLQLAISSSYWPLAWLPPVDAMLSLKLSGCGLTLPLHHPANGTLEPAFAAPEQAPEAETRLLQPSEHNWRLIHDLAANTYTLEVINDQGSFRLLDTDTEITRCTREWYSFQSNEVNSARGETWTRRRFYRPDWDVEVTTSTVLKGDQHSFHIHAQLDAFEQQERIFSHNWSRDIPRDCV